MIDRIKFCIELIDVAIKDGYSLGQICKMNGKGRNYITNTVWEFKNRIVLEDKSSDLKKMVSELNSKLEEFKTTPKKSKISDKVIKDSTSTEYDAYEDDTYDERSVGEPVREGEEITLSDGQTIVNKITSYKYNIKVKNAPDLIGELTREEMNLIYHLYSNMNGAGLTQRSVARHFPSISFPDFKRILRAFNITKSSHPVAPHVIEESSIEDVVDIIYRNKENTIFKRVEEEREKQVEKYLKEAKKEIVELNSKLKDWKSMANQILFDDIIPFKIEVKETKEDVALIVYLSDMHVGAETKENSIFSNPYDEKEFNNRLQLTCEEVIEQYNIFGRFDKIIICNLGDSLDGYNGETTRGGHKLPQNMDNRQQFNVFTNGMASFFQTLYEADIANNIEYMCVGDANHDGDFGYVANRCLEIYLNAKYPDMKVQIFEQFMGVFQYGDHHFILAHGKDKEDMTKGFPLNLNDKIENFINDFLYNKNITSDDVHVVTGDLHQTSINFAKKFRYKKVSSLYGSSSWIHSNFGNTKAAVDYEVVFKNRSRILQGRLKLN